MVSITVPERNIRKVGILCERLMSAGLLEIPGGWGNHYALTPYCLAISCWLSTLTFVKVTLFGFECFVERDS
jgi:hypothetical protein